MRHPTYDWQLPPYKPLHLSVFTGQHHCQLMLTSRKMEKQGNFLSPMAPTHPFATNGQCTLSWYVRSLPTPIYQRYEDLQTYGQQQLNICFVRLARGKHNSIIVQNGRPLATSHGALQFNSHYESGNLHTVYCLQDNCYQLLLQNDTCTFGFTGWFNFAVKNNLDRGLVAKFRIINLRKQNTLHKSGMKLCVYSREKGWKWIDEPISYRKNKLVRQTIHRQYFTLQWKYHLEPHEQLIFSNNIPYTYCDLLAFMSSLRAITPEIQYDRKTLCQTYMNNKVEILTISQGNQSEKTQILLMGRVHPEETGSSFIMEAIIKYLMSDGEKPRILRKNHIFHIVPMVNPDGVILGNSRCSAIGRDLNRDWSAPDMDVTPQIYFIKSFLSQKRKDISLVLDIHQSSIKKNCYVYGPHSNKQPFVTRQLPYILSEIDSNFSFRECNFTIGRDKSGIARKVIWQQFGVPCYSMHYSVIGGRQLHHYTFEDRWQMVSNLMEAILVLSEGGLSSGLIEKARKEVYRKKKEQIMEKLYSRYDNYEIGLRNEYSDSDSQPQEDYVTEGILLKKAQQPSPLEQFTNKLRIQSNLDKLLKSKCKEYLNGLPEGWKKKITLSRQHGTKNIYLQSKSSRRNSQEKSQRVRTQVNIKPMKEYKLEVCDQKFEQARYKIEQLVNRRRHARQNESSKLSHSKEIPRYNSVPKNRKNRVNTLPDELEPIKMKDIVNSWSDIKVDKFNDKFWKLNK